MTEPEDPVSIGIKLTMIEAVDRRISCGSARARELVQTVWNRHLRDDVSLTLALTIIDEAVQLDVRR